jgi:hypothetical protein
MCDVVSLQGNYFTMNRSNNPALVEVKPQRRSDVLSQE